jgi:hypothetical protein
MFLYNSNRQLTIDLHSKLDATDLACQLLYCLYEKSGCLRYPWAVLGGEQQPALFLRSIAYTAEYVCERANIDHIGRYELGYTRW